MPKGHHDHPEHHLHHDVQHGHRNHEERGAHHDRREDSGRDAPHESASNHGRTIVTGRDAATMRPRLIPDYELLPRDDSGGPEFQPYTQEWGDGGYVTGEKAHLSVHGGRDDPDDGDEQSSTDTRRNSLAGYKPPSRRRDETDR
jgi:hypothetical protein